MKLLVSTPHKLILVDSRSGFQTIVESHRTEYYGISWSPDGRTLCLGHSDVENSSLLTTDSYMDSERGWLSYGSMTGPPCLSQAHQILCDGDRVIATNTGRNCITVFRTDDWFYRNYWFDEVLWDRKGKNKCGQHLNSLFLDKGQLWVVAHNHDRKSDVICCDWPSLALIRRVSTQALMAHNIWITPASQIVICDSMRGSVIDAKTNQILWKSEYPQVITRGLASNGRYAFIGESQIGDRTERTFRDSRISVVDINNWQTLGQIPLRASGNLHDIRILDEPDLCHQANPFRGSLRISPLSDRKLAA